MFIVPRRNNSDLKQRHPGPEGDVIERRKNPYIIHKCLVIIEITCPRRSDHGYCVKDKCRKALSVIGIGVTRITLPRARDYRRMIAADFSQFLNDIRHNSSNLISYPSISTFYEPPLIWHHGPALDFPDRQGLRETLLAA